MSTFLRCPRSHVSAASLVSHRLVEALRYDVGHGEYSDTGTSFFQHAVHQDDINASEFDVALHLLFGRFALMGDEFDRQVVPAHHPVTRDGLLICSRRVQNLWHICEGAGHTRTGVAPWCPKKRGVALQLRNFIPLAASMTDSSNCATRPLRVGQVLRFQCM